MSNELAPQPGETAEMFKLRIEKKQAEFATPQPAKLDVQPEPKPTEPVSAKTETPQAINPPAKGPQAPDVSAPSKDEVDPIDWARKKGFKSEEDIARSLREMEAEFHRRNQGKWKQPDVPAPQAPVQPSYQPPMAPAYVPQPAPSYYPMQPNPNALKQQLAQRYNLAPDDLERVLPLIADVAEARIAQRDQQWASKLSQIEKENTRNSEFRELMQDPVFRDPKVQMEMHRILKENDQAFESEPAPFKWAYKEALTMIARRNLQGGLENGSSSSLLMTPPTTPPPSHAGSGEGGSEGQTMTAEVFASLPLDEQAKMLTKLGLRPKPY